MVKSRPFFSVIIPVYNRARLVGETLDTILGQTFTDFEVVCVNDCSTDETLQVLEDYASRDPRIRIVNHEVNKGRCITRNTGIEQARGEWICYLDSDDFYYDNHLATHKELIDRFPDRKAFATEQTWSGKPKPYNRKRYRREFVELRFRDFIDANPISSNQLCYHRSVKTRWVNERLPISEDWLFHRQLSLESPILKYRKLTTDVRQHEGSSLISTDVDTFIDWNLYAARRFVEIETRISPGQRNAVLAFTYILCCNILQGHGKKKRAWVLFIESLKYPRNLLNALFYKAIIKFILK